VGLLEALGIRHSNERHTALELRHWREEERKGGSN
jgi:hypothetical protein